MTKIETPREEHVSYLYNARTSSIIGCTPLVTHGSRTPKGANDLQRVACAPFRVSHPHSWGDRSIPGFESAKRSSHFGLPAALRHSPRLLWKFWYG